MNYFIILLTLFFINFCAQQRIEKQPEFPPKQGVENPEKTPRLLNYIKLGDIKKNKDSLYCWKIDYECNILDGKTTLFTYYQTSGDDNPTLVNYTYAKGEFLQGKYEGVWEYYDKNGKVIKKEKWNNGKLIYKRGFK